jgi:hypothetical protein
MTTRLAPGWTSRTDLEGALIISAGNGLGRQPKVVDGVNTTEGDEK